MNLVGFFRTAEKVLSSDRQALWDANVNPASGKVEDANARELIQEHDSLINWARSYLYALENPHV